MRSYHQLTLEQRYQIGAMLSMTMSKDEIASAVGVHRSTVYREIRRNAERAGRRGDFSYKARRAHQRARQRRVAKGERSRKIRGALRRLVETKLQLGWSPDQISGRLWLERRFQLSHESIYQHVLRDFKNGGWLRYCLRFGGYKHKRFRRTRYRRQTRRSLDHRPSEANERQTFGHWERDLAESTRRGPSLLTIAERKSRYVLIRWIPRATKKGVQQASAKALAPFAPINRSVTNDNGKEFQGAEALEKRLEVPIYYTDPGAPWQRGTVENTIGLARQYFRKRMRFSEGHAWLAPAIQETLNFRPRRTLGYRTPHEVLFDDELNLLTGTLSHLGLKTTASS